MEEADKVSSSAPDEAPHDVAMNEAAAVGPTQTDARDAEEEMIGKTSPPRTTEKTSDTQTNEITSVSKITEETSYPQTTEVTSSPQITEEISVSKITEETSILQTTEVTSSPQITEEISAAKITEETSSPQTTEVTSSPQITEEISAAKITEETSILQTTEVTSSPQITEEISAAKITEETSILQTTEVTSSPQITEEISAAKITEETSSPQTTEVTSSPQITEEISAAKITEETSILQTTEVTSSPQITEEISAAKITEETSSPQTTEVTSPPQITEETSPPQITEETSILQTTEVTSSPQITEEISAAKITEETSSPQITEVTSSPEPAEESDAPVSEVPVKRTSTEAGVRATDPVITEAAVTPQTAAELTPPPRTEAREERVSSSSADLSSEEKHPLTLHPSHEPEPPAAPVLFQPHFPSDRWDSPSVASTDLTMDPLGLKDSAGLDQDVLSQSDDDFMFEPKKSPFQAFSPLSDSLGEAAAARRSVEVSDSPSPDLVQDAYDGDEGHVLSESREIQQEAGADAALSVVNAASDDRPMSLPDILKSSPMNPEKVDSGSSEGSPEFSPVHRSVSESPNSPFSVSTNNLLGFDSKILLLKEMAEVTEARIAEKAKMEEENKSEPSFVAFDLVKETDVPPKSDGLLKDKDDVEVSSQTSVQTAHRFECLNFPSGKAQEHWDSESPSADSFSPVLDAVTQKPPSFTAEQEQRAADEASEPEPSSEEFEFIERPPRGAADEFLETQDSPMFTKPSEVLLDEDRSPELEAQTQSSYHLHAQASDTSAAVRGKAGLESDLQELSPTPVICPPADEPGAGKQEAEGEGGSPMSDVSAAAVLELLYWRDVRSSALVFGSSLFILLSLTCCSIISVLSYAALTLLSVTLTFRIYKGVLQAVQKSDEGHPFKWVLEKDVALTSDAVQRHSDVALSRINGVLKELRRLFLVEDLIDSLKFAVLLWVFTYVGAWFNGLTLLILGLVGAFSGPLTYEKHQTQIDQFISMVNSQMKDVLGKIQAKIPGAKKKPE